MLSHVSNNTFPLGGGFKYGSIHADTIEVATPKLVLSFMISFISQFTPVGLEEVFHVSWLGNQTQTGGPPETPEVQVGWKGGQE